MRLVLVEGGGDLLGDEHRAHRRIRRRQALGDRDQIGRYAKTGDAEVLADPTETGDHLVGVQQDPVLVGELAQPLPVAGRGRQAAAGVLNRLGDDHTNCLRSLLEDHALDLCQQLGGERLALDVGAEPLVLAT